MKKLILTALLLSIIPFLISNAHAIYGVGDSIGLSPYWDYKTIETEHFLITFPVELTATAQKTATYLEEAHEVMSPRLHWEASYKVSILMVDNADSENGATTPVGRFGIALYVTPPDNWFSIYYYDNWLRELCFHEYTHFLNMDATTSFYKYLRYAFGDTLLPNSFWPSWMLEGLAVYDETRLTDAGRGRSPYYEMVLRSAVKEGGLDERSFITLDKVNGPNPYYPGGETAYLFGYHLMNQAAHSIEPGPSFDGRTEINQSEDVLGEMSIRSSRRIPYFINSNLKNIIGKDWYEVWDDFVTRTTARTNKELAIIRAQHATPFKRLTERSFEVLGPRYSPDQKWIAYTQNSLDDYTSALYLRNAKTQERKMIADKTAGATLSFTSDSKFIFSSRLHRINTYYIYSDIEVYDMINDSSYWLTDRLRARDPSLSPDNQSIAFTITRDNTTMLAIAPLKKVDGKFTMGEVEILESGQKFDHVGTPQFSPDGKKIAYSFHRNGDVGEELRVFDLGDHKTRILVRDGKFNRFPTWDFKGELYFVSDLTGVDNLYRYQNSSASPQMVSNYETGVNFPSFFGNSGKYVATVFSTEGWDLAEAQVGAVFQPQNLKMPAFPQPVARSAEEKQQSAKVEALRPVGAPDDKTPGAHDYPIKDYSIWPSILPRSWAPLAVVSNQGFYAGGEISGFDQVDRHRYLFLGAYDSFTKKADALLHYENRSFGPTFETTGSVYTDTESASGNTLNTFTRKEEFEVDGYYTFQYTYSSLTPKIELDETRRFRYVPGANPSDNDITARGRYVPHVDASLTYSDEEASRLAITPEYGRLTQAGSRVYLYNGEEVWKGLFTDEEHFKLGNSHFVLVPAVKGSMVSHFSNYAPANVLAQGRFSGQLINSIAANNFDQLGIRGYPLMAFYTRATSVFSLDARFPIARIFGGWGTNPVFLENLWGFGFGEMTYFPAGDIAEKTLPSLGGGLRLDTDLLNDIPLEFSVEYHNGLRTDVGGRGEVFFQMVATLISL